MFIPVSHYVETKEAPTYTEKNTVNNFINPSFVVNALKMNILFKNILL